MNASVINRRHLVAGDAAAIGVASLSAGIVKALAAEMPCPGPAALAMFDPVAFLADLHAAGCRVALSAPGTCFGPGDERATYFIAPADGRGFGDAYSDVMLRWHEATANHPDPVGAVVAILIGRGETGR